MYSYKVKYILSVLCVLMVDWFVQVLLFTIHTRPFDFMTALSLAMFSSILFCLAISYSDNMSSSYSSSSWSLIWSLVKLVNSYRLIYHIAGMFGGNNVWRDWFDKWFGKKVANWCTIPLLCNAHVTFGWFLVWWNCVHSPNSTNFSPTKQCHYTVCIRSIRDSYKDFYICMYIYMYIWLHMHTQLHTCMQAWWAV